MTYVQGFLTPVPSTNREKYIAHAQEFAPKFRELGAIRFVEAWGDDVPDGKLNDLKKAVDLKDGETVLFSWLEWPDKAAHDAGNEKLMADPALENMEMPFDGKRMVYGGFESILQVGNGQGSYVDGFVVAVPEGRKDAYLAMAQNAAGIFQDYGAVRVVENWEDKVEDGKVTDYNRATLKEPGERVVYSWIEWPDKATRDAGWGKIMADERMKPGDMPFDGKRMMWGGFEPVVYARG